MTHEELMQKLQDIFRLQEKAAKIDVVDSWSKMQRDSYMKRITEMQDELKDAFPC